MECDWQGLPCSRDMGWWGRVLESRPFVDVSAGDGTPYLA
jgi:hypothetical protein